MARTKTTSSESSGVHTFEIPLKLPSLNEYIDVCRRNYYAANKMKHATETQIGVYIARLPKITKPIVMRCVWYEDSHRRDPDNVAFAKKFILDAMVRMGRIKNDTQRYVKGFEDQFENGGQKVVVTLEEQE